MDEHHYRSELVVILVLIIATLTVYWQVQDHEFVSYDDYKYISENRHVQAGLTLESVRWAFTSTHAANWHPLTWLSHMLDYKLYGLNPKGYHFNNLLLHIANSLLIFLVLKRMTGALWRSFFVAALFALHPLHVESVAWAAERKDVLSTFFEMLTILAYTRYVERPGLNRYLLVLLFLVMGLMSKSMLVTLPFVLFLLDYWPLRRFQFGKSSPANTHSHESINQDSQRIPTLYLVLEKVPLLVFITTSSIITFMVQQSGEAVQSFGTIPLKVRIANAFVSYAIYIGKMIWPHHLAIFYPHPGNTLPILHAVGSCLLLIIISGLVIRTMRVHAYLVVGWLWYIGTLVPVIGLVQVGSQAMADRYTYVPLIGLFIMITWGFHSLIAKWYYYKILFIISAIFVLSSLMICSWVQLQYWRNNITLFKHALEVSSNNWLAHNSLGVALARKKKGKEAAEHFQAALRIKPDYENAHNNLAVILANQGKFEDAISHYRAALRINPNLILTHINLGKVLSNQQKFDEAKKHFLTVLRIEPNNPAAHFHLGLALSSLGDSESALKEYEILKSINLDLADKLFSKISK